MSNMMSKKIIGDIIIFICALSFVVIAMKLYITSFFAIEPRITVELLRQWALVVISFVVLFIAIFRMIDE